MAEAMVTNRGRLEVVREPAGYGTSPTGLTEGEDDPKLAERARRLYEQRRRRNAIFGNSSDAFGEPSWDLLLDLFHSEGSGRQISLSSGCIASDSPTTTAMRHVRGLETRGLIRRERDPSDARRW
jgi:DNA-binding MarR family transcriptional regulator